MRKHKNFWDKNAGRYDRFMRKDRAAYDEMYAGSYLDKRKAAAMRLFQEMRVSLI